ncbi:sigma-70 family RNA polymerase sigma factor [Algoriphagus sp.]|uniref:RNA polymerase sigma factor n=1 Tax=Algoriphagus sp. TaxID=1872435 RepID=UPI002617D8D6|nr:sigma-70 family RNA polymerase sigma factor [Algoriphagus sp.]
MIKDQYLVDKLKRGDLKALDEVYLTYKGEFCLFAGKFGLSAEDSLDLYQETMLSFYDNVHQNKLTQLTSTLKTYLFAIGKFKIYKHLDKAKRFEAEEKLIYISEELRLFEVDIQEERQQDLEKAFQRLGAKCREILNLFYYEGMGLDEILHALNYTSKDVLKSQKSRCLKQLKEFVKKDHE